MSDSECLSTTLRFKAYNFLSLSLILFAWTIRCEGVIRTPVVHTDSGPIQGSIKKTVWNGVEYSSFKGIPYAKPPVGNLRFMPPVPPQPWKKTRDAIEEGNHCPQIDDLDQYGGSEDCLYLSVFTPETKFKANMKLRPVMVWIYGGSYVWGYCNTSLYGPDFIEEEDIVLVSFNYRLGALGFLFLDDRRVPGNAGMKDQVLALEWVQRNIRAFGGDPQQVTIFGQSAGGTSVSYHLLSQRSRDLFNYSIVQSGAATITGVYQTPEEALLCATKLANAMGWVYLSKEQLLQHYLNADAKELVLTTEKMSVLSLNISVPFSVVKENPAVSDPDTVFLTECPITLLQTGKFTKRPMIIGWVQNEALMFSKGVFEIVNNTAKLWNQLLPFYPFNIPAAYQAVTDAAMLASDLVFKPPIDLIQRLMALYNNYPIYFYQFNFISKYSVRRANAIPVHGTGHMDDIVFTFNVERLNAPTDPNAPFNQFRRMVVKLWTNFAKTGNPTPPDLNPLGNVVWEPSGTEGKQLNISVTPSMNSRLVNKLVLLSEYVMYLALPAFSACCNITNPTPNNTNDPPLNVTWVESGVSGKQFDFNTTITLNDRLIDKRTQDFEKLYYAVLSGLSTCISLGGLDIF